MFLGALSQDVKLNLNRSPNKRTAVHMDAPLSAISSCEESWRAVSGLLEVKKVKIVFSIHVIEIDRWFITYKHCSQ